MSVSPSCGAKPHSLLLLALLIVVVLPLAMISG